MTKVTNSQIKTLLENNAEKTNSNFGKIKLSLQQLGNEYAPISLVQTVSDKADKNHTHSQYLTSHQDISGKANMADLAKVATTGSYNDLINKPTIPAVPTNVSAFTNDAGYLTSHQDISGKENTSNKVASLSANSTDTQYPSAKCVYDLIGNVEALLQAV